MWMVFNSIDRANGIPAVLIGGAGLTPRSVTAKNGTVYWANGSVSYGGLIEARFVSDSGKITTGAGWAASYDVRANIAQRNATSTNVYAAVSGPLVNKTVNDVSMTVLHDAPVDPATGLPVPTIAVATAGGVSVIKDDGTVVDITHATSSFIRTVEFRRSDQALCYSADTSTNQGRFRVVQHEIPETDLALSAAWVAGASDELYPMALSAPYSGTSLPLSANDAIASRGWDGTNDAGSTQLSRILPNRINPQNGALAVITSTYNTGWLPGDIKGAWLSDTDPTDLVGSGELVTNGTFDTDATGWAALDSTLSVSAGELVITATANSEAYATQTMTVEVGKAYVISVDHISGNASQDFLVGSTDGGAQLYNGPTISNNTTETITVIATTTLLSIRIRVFSTSIGQFGGADNISVKLADTDRSVNNNHLTVNGTITRTPVATGAELVAYSGFSAGVNELALTDASISDTLYGLCWVQVSGVWELQHGVMSTSPIEGVTIAGTTLTVEGANAKALLRLTATAPTAEQIAKIYADERPLFQENAACTLYGTSDAVTALAHDEVTDLLHVGTSAGRSDFQGLSRVSNTTTAVAAAISAHDGLIIEE